MFALTRILAKERDVSEIVAPLDVLQRHMLAALAGRLGVSGCRSDMVRATLAWARLDRDLPPIVSRFRTAGARVAPIKGVAYATRLYTVPGDRPMTDVDILVPPSDRKAATSALRELGFTLHPDPALHHASTWARGDLVIDVHHGILGDGRSRVDLGAVWQRTRPGWPDGAERLEPADELAFHLLHMTRNRLCGPLIQVIDAGRLAERDAAVDIALKRAASWGVGAAARLAWRFVGDVLADRETPGGVFGPRVSDVLAVRQPPTLGKLVFDVATAGSLRQLAARVVAFGRSRLAN